MRLLTMIPALLITLNAPAQGSAVSRTVDQMRDLYRPILIFAPTGDPRVSQQVEILQAHRKDLIERQIVLVPFFHRYAGPVDGEIIALLPQQEPTLRRRFHVPGSSFTVILIGKDGGEKLRSQKLISFQKLRDTIDSMPMRKQEMQSRSKVP